MSNQAKAMLERIRSTKSENRRATITLDAATVQLVEKWRIDNLATTVRHMLRVADEQLTEQQRALSVSNAQASDGGAA